nr:MULTISPECIES: hypothetical protein [unclassified Rhodococcus (in: high G+C Gram-positive bacteria)]
MSTFRPPPPAGSGNSPARRRKNDRIAAAAAVCVVALPGDARPVDPEGPTDVLALRDEHRTNRNSRTRIVNQFTPCSGSEVDRIRIGLCQALIADIRRLDDRLAENEKQMTRTLDEHGTRLREVDGIGPMTVARLIGRTGRASRFPTAAGIGFAQLLMSFAVYPPPSAPEGSTDSGETSRGRTERRISCTCLRSSQLFADNSYYVTRHRKRLWCNHYHDLIE